MLRGQTFKMENTTLGLDRRSTQQPWKRGQHLKQVRTESPNEITTVQSRNAVSYTLSTTTTKSHNGVQHQVTPRSPPPPPHTHNLSRQWAFLPFVFCCCLFSLWLFFFLLLTVCLTAGAALSERQLWRPHLPPWRTPPPPWHPGQRSRPAHCRRLWVFVQTSCRSARKAR